MHVYPSHRPIEILQRKGDLDNYNIISNTYEFMVLF